MPSVRGFLEAGLAFRPKECEMGCGRLWLGPRYSEQCR